MATKRIPYGVSDYEKIVIDNNYYVDKTRFIQLIEETGYFLFFLRPRRFGKSLLLSVLETYYDIYKKDKFDVFYNNTWIGQNPTPMRNSYYILSFNFSMVNPDENKLEESFETHCDIRFIEFCLKYRPVLDEEFLANFKTLTRTDAKLQTIFSYCKFKNLPLFVMIDEYDNFANTILSTHGKDKYHKLTHGEGFFRYFFNVIKGGSTGSGASISRLFITGVSPLAMDDVTSGFNIGNNISQRPEFNEMVGFTAEEVETLLQYYQSENKIDNIDTIFALMTEWYNNYLFSTASKISMYNTDMVLYFINQYFSFKQAPDNLIDPNVKTDYSKLRHLIILDQHLNGNFSILKGIVENEEVSAHLESSFQAKQLIEKDKFVSLLHYLGIVSIVGFAEGKTRFKIPNECIKKFYSDYIINAYKETEAFKIDLYDYNNLVNAMAFRGEYKAVFEFLGTEIKRQTKIRDYINGESMIKGFLLAYLNITDYMIIHTEKEMNKGFADFFMQAFTDKYQDVKYSYLIEVKYLKRQRKKPYDKIKAAETAALTQLQQYAQDEFVVQRIAHTQLICIALVYHGWELVSLKDIR